jgi:N-sulfoglucosamine sulfohydrolase
MRDVLNAWQKETNDSGLVPENELRERMRPGGIWVKVAQPVISENISSDTVRLRISCPTEGASFAYATEEGKNVRWLLYTGELTLKRPALIRVKGCRFGYLDSEEVMKRY